MNRHGVSIALEIPIRGVALHVVTEPKGPSSRIGPLKRSNPECEPLRPRAWPRRPGPFERSVALPRRRSAVRRPSTTSPPRIRTAFGVPAGPTTTLAHQCTPYDKYTYNVPAGPYIGSLRLVRDPNAWLAGSSFPPYASTSVSLTATRSPFMVELMTAPRMPVAASSGVCSRIG